MPLPMKGRIDGDLRQMGENLQSAAWLFVPDGILSRAASYRRCPPPGHLKFSSPSAMGNHDSLLSAVAPTKTVSFLSQNIFAMKERQNRLPSCPTNPCKRDGCHPSAAPTQQQQRIGRKCLPPASIHTRGIPRSKGTKPFADISLVIHLAHSLWLLWFQCPYGGSVQITD